MKMVKTIIEYKIGDRVKLPFNETGTLVKYKKLV